MRIRLFRKQSRTKCQYVIEALAKGRCILGIWYFATISSFVFTLIGGMYNGDFSRDEVSLSALGLSFALLLTIIPYIVVWKLYRHYVIRYFNSQKHFTIPIRILRNVTWVLIIVSILLFLSGYGRMGQGENAIDASNPITILRSIIYKLTKFPWAYMCLLLVNKKRDVVITALLSSLRSVAAFSLGGLLWVALILVYKYYSKVAKYFKKYIIIWGIMSIMIPGIIAFLYNVRTQLRSGNDIEEMTGSELIFGKLCGRISSFSNNAIMLERVPLVLALADTYPTQFLFYDAVGFFGIHSSSFKSVGNVMQVEIVGSPNEDYQTMAGFGGVMVLSVAKSILVMCINLALIMALLYLVYYLPYRFKWPCCYGIALFSTIGFCISSDVSDLSVTVFGYIIIYYTLKFLKRVKSVR